VHLSRFFPVLPLLALATSLGAAPEAAAILASRCLACHGQSAAGGLRLDQAEGVRRVTQARGTEPGLLIQAIRHTGARLKMPPGKKLDEAEIAVLEDWVKAGAPLADAGRTLWSVASIPPVAPSTSIDKIVRNKLAEIRLTPNGPADRRTLLRRLSYDLTGLPPTPDQGEAVSALVDRLLASRHFGERWGRYWLDLARYGEEDFSGTAPRPYPNAWRYRDWVIDMVNRDMPYDLFLQAQIAGDLLPAARGFTPESYRAGLGLFGAGPWYYGISMPAQARADERHDRVDMVSRGMLGLTVACARCHDHKYDAIPQKDYYALAGVFASSAYQDVPLVPEAEVNAYREHQKKIETASKALDTFEEQQSLQLAEVLAASAARYIVNAERCRRGERVEPGLNDTLLARWEDYLAANPVADAAAFQAKLLAALAAKKALDEENRDIVAQAKLTAVPVQRKIVLPFGYRSEEDFNPGADVPTKSLPYEEFQLCNRFTSTPTSLLRFRGGELDGWLGGVHLAHLQQLRQTKAQLEKNAPREYPYLHAMAEGEAWDLHLDLRGNPHEHGDVVPRAFPTLLGGGSLREGSGRLALAYKVTAHPLAARVAVNRIWRNLFGSGLVRTPSNFGVVGDRPVLPELLDYLAARFIASGYSTKTLIREIVLSETYQASSTANPANEKLDAENRYWWKANRRRLDAEALRDSMLSVAGRLDLTAGGESAPVDGNRRRTVYARVSRFKQDDTLSLFDFPSASVTCEQRVVTNVPLQKLYFLNSAFLNEQAEALAQRFQSVDEAYRLVYHRPPSANERTLGEAFLTAEGAKAYAQVLLSANEFAFLD